jgi:cellulose synthase/poly-beta-1,6-N-acetylglucosamine synthase-like glycosyltransferase
MDKICLLIFGFCVLLVAHTYLFYPFIMILLFSKPKRKNNLVYANDDLPTVAVLVAAFNEERVIGEKIVSVFNTGYPLSKLKVYVGSDASVDSTDSIVESLKLKYANLELVRFDGRVGKISIINHLQSLGDEEILIMTDANVMFKPETIYV